MLTVYTRIQATPTSFVKALYDYAAAAPGEVTVADGQVLSVHEKEDDWILVEFELDGKKGKFLCGYVPANYVEEVSEPPPFSLLTYWLLCGTVD
jgi:actin cytoskeleton-regulatory complex protein SLA1